MTDFRIPEELIIEVVQRYIHNEKYRGLLIRRMTDGITQEKLAEEFELSVRQTQRILAKYQPIVVEKIWEELQRTNC